MKLILGILIVSTTAFARTGDVSSHWEVQWQLDQMQEQIREPQSQKKIESKTQPKQWTNHHHGANHYWPPVKEQNEP